jgi:hypothetical protein
MVMIPLGEYFYKWAKSPFRRLKQEKTCKFSGLVTGTPPATICSMPEMEGRALLE